MALDVADASWMLRFCIMIGICAEIFVALTPCDSNWLAV